MGPVMPQTTMMLKATMKAQDDPTALAIHWEQIRKAPCTRPHLAPFDRAWNLLCSIYLYNRQRRKAKAGECPGQGKLQIALRRQKHFGGQANAKIQKTSRNQNSSTPPLLHPPSSRALRRTDGKRGRKL